LNGLILNWCIGGCWFTPAVVQVGAVKIYLTAVEALRKKERRDETQFTTKIG